MKLPVFFLKFKKRARGLRVNSFKKRYQNNLESMKGKEFVFDYVHLLSYKCHKINPISGGSYIDSFDWIKHQKATINLINKKYNKYFQYPVIVTLNHEETGKNAERIIKHNLL